MKPLNRLQIAWRAAQDIGDGMVVNLGMGMPVAVADYLRPEADVFIHSENGVIGAGPLAAPEHIDTDLVDAGSRRITLRPGAAIVDSSWRLPQFAGVTSMPRSWVPSRLQPTAIWPTGTCACRTRARWLAAPWI